MRFTFLGTGTSAGVPTIGCECAVCTSTDPRDQRLRTGAALEFVDASGHPRTILIDTTPDLRTQALRARLARCDAVVYTHNHVDHTFGLDEVRRFNVVQKSPIDIYADEHTTQHLRRVYTHIFDAHKNVNDSFVATLIPHIIDHDRAFELYGVRFTPIPLLHGRLPILGFRIETVSGADHGFLPMAYCTDVSGIPPESWRLLRGVRTLVLDALRRRKHPTHFALDESVSTAARVGAARTYFVHMAHDLGHEATNAELPDGVELAHDGLSIGDANENAGALRPPRAVADPD